MDLEHERETLSSLSPFMKKKVIGLVKQQHRDVVSDIEDSSSSSSCPRLIRRPRAFSSPKNESKAAEDDSSADYDDCLQDSEEEQRNGQPKSFLQAIFDLDAENDLPLNDDTMESSLASSEDAEEGGDEDDSEGYSSEDEPPANRLYCASCGMYRVGDDFSSRQSQVVDDKVRYCLRHTSTSAFGSSFSKPWRLATGLRLCPATATPSNETPDRPAAQLKSFVRSTLHNERRRKRKKKEEALYWKSLSSPSPTAANTVRSRGLKRTNTIAVENEESVRLKRSFSKRRLKLQSLASSSDDDEASWSTSSSSARQTMRVVEVSPQPIAKRTRLSRRNTNAARRSQKLEEEVEASGSDDNGVSVRSKEGEMRDPKSSLHFFRDIDKRLSRSIPRQRIDEEDCPKRFLPRQEPLTTPSSSSSSSSGSSSGRGREWGNKNICGEGIKSEIEDELYFNEEEEGERVYCSLCDRHFLPADFSEEVLEEDDSHRYCRRHTERALRSFLSLPSSLHHHLVGEEGGECSFMTPTKEEEDEERLHCSKRRPRLNCLLEEEEW